MKQEDALQGATVRCISVFHSNGLDGHGQYLNVGQEYTIHEVFRGGDAFTLKEINALRPSGPFMARQDFELVDDITCDVNESYDRAMSIL